MPKNDPTTFALYLLDFKQENFKKILYNIFSGTFNNITLAKNIFYKTHLICSFYESEIGFESIRLPEAK